MIAFAFLEVSLISRIVRVGFAFDFDVSLNGRAICEPQPHCLWAALVIVRFPEKAPVVKSLPPKVLLFEPAAGFFWMPSPGPSPQTPDDGGVHALKDSFTHHMPVIVGPTPYFGIQPIDQLGRRQAQAGFDCLPNTVQEDFHIFLGGFDEQFPIRVLAHVLSEEIKALFHVRDDRLLERELQTSRLQELLHEGFHFSFQ